MEYFDTLETRDPEARERALLAALPAQVEHAKRNAAGFARILKDVDPRAVVSRAALAKLPVTRKSDLKDLQRADPHLPTVNPAHDAPRARSDDGHVVERHQLVGHV